MNKQTIKSIIEILIAGIPYFIMVLSAVLASVKKIKTLSKNTFNYGKGLIEQAKEDMAKQVEESEKVIAELKKELGGALEEVKQLTNQVKSVVEQNELFKEHLDAQDLIRASLLKR